MRTINSAVIQNAVAKLCIKANTQLRADVLFLLKKAYRMESAKKAKSISYS